MNKNILIIPDIHHKWETAEKIIKAVNPDQTIFLGDYFDSFDENANDVNQTADWLVQSANNPSRIHLLGNHCMHYAFASKYFECSGYAQWKYFIINDIVKRDTWNKLKYFHVLDNTWLLTHAGLHEYFIPTKIKNMVNDKPKMFDELKDYLTSQIILGHRDQNWIFKAGQIRGGEQVYGGITWCDYREFKPMKQLHQIFGHTNNRNVRYNNIINDIEVYSTKYDDFSLTIENLNDPNSSYNICIDTDLDHYAIWNGKCMKIYKTSEL